MKPLPLHVTLEIPDEGSNEFLLAYYDTAKTKDGHALKVYSNVDFRADLAAAIVALRDWEEDDD